MRCAVIILNWNGEKYLDKFLPSVVEYTQGEGISVVVADNGSTDKSVELIRRHYPSIKLLELPKNYGFAEGYNKAIGQIEAEYVVLLNSDVEVTKGWLDTLLDYMDRHNEIAACQPKIRAYNKRTHFEHAGAAGGMMDKLGYPFCRGRIVGYAEEDKGQYDSVANIFWATGACMLIRRDAYINNGGLDSDFFAHQEEIDLCWRLLCRGYKIVCVPQSVVYHVGGAALSYQNPRKTYLNFRNNLLLLYKNLPDNKLCKILSIRLLMDYAAAAQFLVIGQWQNVKAVFRARRDYHRMRKSFAGKRKENISKTKVPYPDEIAQRSIIWDYYVRRRRK